MSQFTANRGDVPRNVTSITPVDLSVDIRVKAAAEVNDFLCADAANSLPAKLLLPGLWIPDPAKSQEPYGEVPKLVVPETGSITETSDTMHVVKGGHIAVGEEEFPTYLTFYRRSKFQIAADALRKTPKGVRVAGRVTVSAAVTRIMEQLPDEEHPAR